MFQTVKKKGAEFDKSMGRKNKASNDPRKAFKGGSIAWSKLNKGST